MAQEGSTLEKFVFTWQSVCIFFFSMQAYYFHPLWWFYTRRWLQKSTVFHMRITNIVERGGRNRNLLSPFSKVTNGYCFFRIIIFLYNKRTWNLQTSHLGYRFFFRGIFFFSQAAFSSRLTIISSSRAFFLLLIIVSKSD